MSLFPAEGIHRGNIDIVILKLRNDATRAYAVQHGFDETQKYTKYWVEFNNERAVTQITQWMHESGIVFHSMTYLKRVYVHSEEDVMAILLRWADNE